MANLTKGLKKLRRRFKKLAAEVAELRGEKHPPAAAEAAEEAVPARPAPAGTGGTSSQRTARKPATTTPASS